jgi:prophage antirepressor-like protein
MNKQVSNFLEFNGKTLVFLAVDGEYWIALKPICEVLGVDFSRQLRTLKEDPIFSVLWSLQTIVAADEKSRKMASLPEKWIYGWIMQLESKSPDLLQYKKLCYEVLNNYFHGSITGRKSLLQEKAKLQIEIDSVFNQMPVKDSLLLLNATKKLNRINVQLRSLDGEMIQEERNLFNI